MTIELDRIVTAHEFGPGDEVVSAAHYREVCAHAVQQQEVHDGDIEEAVRIAYGEGVKFGYRSCEMVFQLMWAIYGAAFGILLYKLFA